MSEYRIYRVGEAEPVGVGGVPRPLATSRGTVASGSTDSPRAWVAWLGVVAALVVGGALFWVFGRESLGNAQAALDLARLSGKIPGWGLVLAPIVGVAVVALVSTYLAFGRHVVLKALGILLVIVAVAAPGVAVGWANGLVKDVSQTPAKSAEVKKAKQALSGPSLPGKPMNVLLIGSDKSSVPGDPGRSDTQILMRLDPETKSISMLSLPRDLRVDIPGVGYNKMNAAYSYGGPKLVIQTFKELTGLPINHFVEINFAGFWHVVNILGGVYIPVDHRYYVPESADYKSIDIQPGYQLLDGHDSLDFVRFRHDQRGDFTRMQRQQMYLKELQRQSGRWSSDWGKVIRLVHAITKQTTSDMDSLRRLKPLLALIFAVNTSKVNTVHLEGSTPMINGISYVEASSTEIAQAVEEFQHPQAAPLKISGAKLTKKMYPIDFYNAGAMPGYATAAAQQVKALGYRAEAIGDAPESATDVTIVYAPKSLQAPAQLVGEMMWPSDVRLIDRAPGVDDAITVFVGSKFDGQITVPKVGTQTQQPVVQEKYAASSWRALDRQTPLHLEMPTIWSPGLSYDQFRAYGIKMNAKKGAKRTAAAVAVGMTPSGSYFDIQAMRWNDPPAIANPNTTQVIAGTRYMLFYQGDNLHMVAWEHHGTLYWVINGLDNELSNDFMMALAKSCKPLK